jgi:N-acetylmuramoyl-L-alanine amidase
MRIRSRTDFIVIHCSATDDDIDIGVAEIRRWHVERGFADIGYHFVIRRDGRIEKGRDIGVTGAHVEGWNSRSVGVCMVGGVEADDMNRARDNFTEAQWASLLILVKTLMEKYPTAKVLGHRDFPKVAKACPSFDVRGWLTRVGLLVPAT